MFQSYRNQSLICRANQLTGFYMMGTLVVKGLKTAASQIYELRNKRSFRTIAQQESVFVWYGSETNFSFLSF